MKKQALNPYLPNYEYVPDGEPYVFGDRVYVYGSHDRFGGDAFCMNDYVCWSASPEDLGNWRYEGVIYRKEQDPRCRPDSCMYAPDVVLGPDGRYYLYYTLDFEGTMAVAVADSPIGPYAYYGRVRTPDGNIVGDRAGDVYQYDPGVLVDDDGRVWLYSGFSSSGALREKLLTQCPRLMDGAYCMELEQDMLTVKSKPKCIIPWKENAEPTSFEGMGFFEASSIRKIGKLYYFVYSSQWLHQLCYAVSKHPDRDFVPGGVLVSNGDIGTEDWTLESSANYYNNNHGGMVQIKGQWYIFYHRHTNYSSYSRQGCAEKLTIAPDGSIRQAELTSCGLNEGDLCGQGIYPAAIACHLYSKDGACNIRYLKENKEKHPAFTQKGADREDTENQYITNLRDGSTAGFRYFDLSKTTGISVTVRGTAGTIQVLDGKYGKMLAEISCEASDALRSYSTSLVGGHSHSALYFVFRTEGSMDFLDFSLTAD